MPEQDKTARFIQAFPKYLLLFTILFLITLYILIWLIDFRQVYVPGLTEWKDLFPANLFWLQVFREGGIVENMQWLYLAFSFLISILCLFSIKKQTNKYHIGFVLLSVGLLLMFLEDMANLRHYFSYYVSLQFYDGIAGSYEWRISMFRTMLEIAVYTVLGTIMLLAFFKIFFDKNFCAKARKYLLIGYLFYGVASIASATRNIGSWYQKVGTRLFEWLQAGKTYEWNSESILFFEDPLSFWFMDLPVEESIELLGASLIFSSTLLFLFSFNKIMNYKLLTNSSKL